MDAAFKIPWLLYVGALVIAPLAFGATEEWSFFLVFVLLGMAFAVFMLQAWRHQRVLYRVPGTLFFLAGFIYVLFQLLPLPCRAAAWLSPAAADLWQAVFLPEGGRSFFPVSLHMEGGLITLAQLAAFYLVYYLGIQLFTAYRVLKTTLTILAFFAGFLALSTIFQSVFTKDMALWFRYVPQNSMVFGPYVNHNHYAGLMEMLLPLVLALYLIHKPSLMKTGLREKILGFLERDSAYRYLLPLFFAVIIMLSVFMSLSRSGIMSMVISMGFFIVLIQKIGTGKRAGRFGVVLSVLLFFFLSWYGWDRLDARFGLTIKQFEYENLSRLTFWRDAMRIIRDFPLTGSGAGSFQEVHPVYQSYPLEPLVGYVHNDYLELVSDSGLIGLFFFLGFMGAVLIPIVRKMRLRKERYAIFGASAALTGILAIALHSMTDFNLQIPANGLFFMLLLGLGLSFSHTRFREHLEPTYLAEVRPRYGIYLLFFLILWLPLAVYSGGAALGRLHSLSLPKETVGPGIAPDLLQKYAEAAGKASFYNPFNAEFQAAMGDAFFFRGEFGKAAEFYLKSLRFKPLSGEVAQKWGLCAYYDGDTEKGEYLLKQGIALKPQDVRMHERLVSFYLETRQWDKVMEKVRAILTARPDRTEDFLALMDMGRMSFTAMGRAMPEKSEAWYRYHLYVKKLGFKTDYSLDLLEKALVVARGEKTPYRHLYPRLAGEYLARKRVEDAFDVMHEGLAVYPEDSVLLHHAGRACESMQLYSRARAYYEKSLRINPAMSASRKRLEALAGK